MAVFINLNDTMFLISQRSLNVFVPARRTDTLTSARMEPSSILARDTPNARAISRILRRYLSASSGDEMNELFSGFFISKNVTISNKVTPVRL